MAKVELKHIDKVYPGDVKAVDDFNLEIKDGEFLVLVGPSGCGKSTTLRMIAGLEEISAGTISIGDRTVNDVPPKDRDIAMVFQNYALYPHMTVRDNMAFGLKLRKFPKKEIAARIDDAARILHLTDYLDRRPKALSGGQRQRVAVGRAIVRKPAVFLFDEPLSNLDAKLRVQMRVEISRLHNQLGTTMIYVTHDQVEAMTMGQRIVVMKDGLIQQVADPITLYDNPVNRFVAGFIGTPPMNFIEGHIRAEHGKLLFEGPGGIRLPVPGKHADTIGKYSGKAITLGLRPEDIGSNAAEAVSDAPHVTAKVEVVEPMGAESYVYLRAGDADFISRVDAHRRFTVGDTVSPAVYMDKTHFFDPRTEQTIA
ncbi:MAG: sn-glycerol-3-phosphate ABC transporter ATP-binding protein UgpC [Verrucomicrobia bacterium]|nr:sn-glycerol-3-phosphate ABC transporter ATP-binding protein UgpC [Verrucomicrobiota bacterium]